MSQTTAIVTQIHGAATVFVVDDVARSVEYYRDALGFRVEFTWGDPVTYDGVERGRVLIHLQASRHAKRTRGQAGVYVFVDDVDPLFAEFKRRGALLQDEPKDYPYGMRDFGVKDPDGNDLYFGSEVRAAGKSEDAGSP